MRLYLSQLEPEQLAPARKGEWPRLLIESSGLFDFASGS